ncbi:hypothetical protein ACRARG_01240 [Pseudooceanicola sp. C21-150M6]|uniref:hypothetical protein n=1 Tax=Pseudooceanicola sp. C21-150M6 TaxID=3434355 RepID=UPI003D7F5464
MIELLIPLVFSLAAIAAGTLCRYRGARYLLIGMGGLTAAALVLLIAAQLIAQLLGCEGASIRSMTCPAPTLLSGLVLRIGGIAALLTLPGLVAGPVAAPLAGLAEYWWRRNRKPG